jgi:uncharacterized protein DUF1376
MSAADSWMPLYIGRYLGDTMHLKGPEHGAYLLLIMHYWSSGPLEDDDETLAAIARTELAEWRRRIGRVVRGGRAGERRDCQKCTWENSLPARCTSGQFKSPDPPIPQRAVSRPVSSVLPEAGALLLPPRSRICLRS